MERVPGGVIHNTEDWQVRVFGTSGIVDKPYERLYMITITLSGDMDRRSHYKGQFYQVTPLRMLMMETFRV